ncbi:hypothetical protein E3N88_43966 [Mikania micrantha]|uniref:CCHC-type domain-containing protein n=1 Tax=Mikania micrantha TaxID=192012 RepID=A0A5N6LDE6_9ASTR|nr:hypothetical protein E3N88_43966 [Mikania micrantha]
MLGGGRFFHIFLFSREISRAGTLTRKGSKIAETKANTDEPSKEAKTEPINPTKPNTHKRKAMNFAMMTPVIPSIPLNQQAPQNNKPYMGTSPLCNTCRYHHPSTRPCRICTQCVMYGHSANHCRNGPLLQQGQQIQLLNQRQVAPANPALINGRACYECGDLNHLRNQCPRLANNNQRATRARTLQLVAQDAQTNQDV